MAAAQDRSGGPGEHSMAPLVPRQRAGLLWRSAAWLQHGLALSVYSLLSLVVTWPTALHFTTQALGELYIDRAQNIWNGWWVKSALVDGLTNPFHTNLLLYPQGADLYFHALDLPGGLIGLGPLLLWGPIAGYNSTALVALVLSGYAGFRLVRYLTGNEVAGLAGGIIIGFSPFAQAMLRGQVNLVFTAWFVFCIEAYLRAWAGGGRRAAMLAGGFFVLAVLTVGYFEVLLLVFFAVHLLWVLATEARHRTATLRRAGTVLVWAGGTAGLLLSPYLLGAWQSLQTGQMLPGSDQDAVRTLLKSADLVSFLLPARDHWLLGAAAPWWQVLDPGIHDYTYLGLAPLGLAGLGVWRQRRRALPWLWIAVAGLGVILALGPVLQINHQTSFGGRAIPLPFELLQTLPLFNFVRAPERFIYLTYLALGVLAGFALVGGSEPGSGGAAGAAPAARPSGILGHKARLAVVALVLLEMPLHLQYTEAMPVPASLEALAHDPAPGAVLELPLTQHGWVDAYRMYDQTAYGRPITSAYLSRQPPDPYTEACSPLREFHDYPAQPAPDIVAPIPSDHDLAALLTASGITFLTVYKQGYTDANQLAPLPAEQLEPLQALAGRLGTPLADDPVATVYRLQPVVARPGLALQLGADWYQLEALAGQPFRWLKGVAADLCVRSPAPHTAPLTLQTASFQTIHRLQVWVNDHQVLDAAIAPGWALQPLRTPAIVWPAGPQRVRLVVDKPGPSPASLGMSTDPRPLSLGFGPIRLGPDVP